MPFEVGKVYYIPKNFRVFILHYCRGWPLLVPWFFIVALLKVVLFESVAASDLDRLRIRLGSMVSMPSNKNPIYGGKVAQLAIFLIF